MNYAFHERCPSYKQVLNKSIDLIKKHGECEISWGEHAINIITSPSGKLVGFGWIRKTSGDAIAADAFMLLTTSN